MKTKILEAGWIITVNEKTAFGGWVFEDSDDLTEQEDPVAALKAHGYKVNELFEISTRWKEFADRKNPLPEGIIEELGQSED